MGKSAVKNEFKNKKNFDTVKCEEGMKIDRLKSLPSEVLDLILVKLPLRDAIRTSILSKEWKYTWHSLSQFAFHSNEASWKNVRKIVRQYIHLHNDAIDKFSLSANFKKDCYDLCQWIDILSKKSVKDFVLEQYNWFSLQLPSSMFTLQQLRHLNLKTCEIKILPPAFIELSSLASLHLMDVCIDDDTLENLILSCPVLERLTLIDIRMLGVVKIHGPNLKYLKLESNFENISFRNTQRLASIDMKLTSRGFYQIKDLACNLLPALGSLPGLRRLSLLTPFFQYLDINDAIERLCNAFNNLVAVDLQRDMGMFKITFSVL